MTDRRGGISQPIHEFFEIFADAMSFFRGPQNMPNANCNGCHVRVLKGRSLGKVDFSFLDKKGRVVKVKLDMRAMEANPKEYMDMTLQDIADTMAHANRESRIIVPVRRMVRPIMKKPPMVVSPRR